VGKIYEDCANKLTKRTITVLDFHTADSLHIEEMKKEVKEFLRYPTVSTSTSVTSTLENMVFNQGRQVVGRGGQGNFFKGLQNTNQQVLGLILLLQIRKFLRCASPQILKPKIFMIDQQITNPHFHTKLHNSVCKQS
jgi:hypothetical protein